MATFVVQLEWQDSIANVVHLPMSRVFGVLDDVADELVKHRWRGESVSHKDFR